MPSLSLGIDIGGTFTDLVVFDPDAGACHSHKELTTHDDPSRGVIAGVRKLLSAGRLAGSDVGRVVHATTLFTNALLERRGAKTGLVTTLGFRDVLEIGRERRYELFDLNIRRPAPLVPRDLRREIPERMDATGNVLVPLDVEALLREVTYLQDQGVTSLAIAFLHSYANPAHEILAASEVRRAFPQLAVSCSHEIAPVIREDERFSTTVANAYVKPLASVYLDQLVEGLALQGIQAPLLLMLSDGGLTARSDVMRAPIKAIESGPAAGVIAATAFGVEVGEPELLAFDMGGTTAKLCLVSGGKPGKSGLFEAARARRFIKGSGLPIRTPAIELIEIGAGGGSIAAADHLGLLKVGPESAGSSPGPACFALGGTQPTVTDANFVLGYLDARTFAGGSLPIEPELGKAAIQRLARELDMSLERTAWGIVDVVNETMARAASVHIAEHGRDPRQFVLAATGGGGPLHAYQVARKLGVRRILCPAGAGVASAIGLLRAPASVTSMKTRIEPFESIDWTDLERVFLQLEDESRTILQGTGVDPRQAVARRHAELRYAGQSSETSVELEPGPFTTGRGGRASALAAFERSYLARYAKTPRSTNIELTAVKVEVAAAVPQWSDQAAMDDAAFAGICAASRPVYFPELGGYADTRIYHRGELASGQRYRGPAIVEDRTSTIVVGPRASFGVAAAAHLLIEIDDEGQEGSA